jgi:prepilin-type N-terminal cleavage/methylation domain-containing protein
MKSTRAFAFRKRGPLNESGFSLVEMLIAASILAIMAASLASVQRLMSRQSVADRERVYASQKALLMMDELRAVVAVGEQQGIVVLDDYDQGNVLADPTGGNSVSIKANAFSPVLTTNMAVTDAGNQTSLNRSMGTLAGGIQDWRYLRNVYIRTPQGETDKNVRLVTVRIFRASDVDGKNQPTPLAEVTGVLRSVGESLVPSQVYDIYVLGIYNIPGWWVNVGQLQTTFRDVVGDIMNRNPGFTPRVHYITKMAFGRDKEYAPFINGPFTDNEDVSNSWLTNNTNMPYVYFYPGHMTTDLNGTVPYDMSLYWSNLLNDDGAQVRIGNNTVTQLVNNVTQNPSYPEHYSLADQYNHAVRYPEEVRLYQEAWNMAQALNPNDPTKWPEPSLRMLLEWMNSQPTKFKNALIINLGGEMLPIPTMRNYSDASKWPDGAVTQFATMRKNGTTGTSVTITANASALPVTDSASITYGYNSPIPLAGFRVVTHPEQLQYPATLATPFPATTPTLPVTLRVYPYMFPADWYPNTTTLPVVSVFLPFDQFPNTSLISVTKYEGRASEGSVAAVTYASASATINIDYTVAIVNGGTLIKLFNTPMRHLNYSQGTASVWGGIKKSSNRFDPDLEYFPCPLSTASPYSKFVLGEGDLADTTTNKPKNTARWTIALPLSTSPDANPHVIETRLMDEYNWANNYAPGTAGAALCPVTFYKVDETPVTVAMQYNTATGVPVTVSNFPATTYAEGVTTDLQNLSRTYVWVGQQAPRTEQFQVFGPPQYCPYSDVVSLGGYNWFWGSLSTTNYPAFPKATTYSCTTGTSTVGTTSGWEGSGLDTNPLEFDYPRVCQLYREGLMKTTSIWSTLNGYSYWAFGLGGEIGAEGQFPTAGGIHMMSKPWITSGTSAAVVVNEMDAPGDYTATSNTYRGRKIIATSPVTINSAPVTWKARYWLGELCPDRDYTNWWSKDSATSIVGGGNLTIGTGTDQFYRSDYVNFYEDYSSGLFCTTTGSLAESAGPVQFINGTTLSLTTSPTTSWFRPGNDNGATITSLGNDLSNLFNFPMPTDFSNDPTRPFVLNDNSCAPNCWTDPDIASQRVSCDIPSINSVSRVFYTHGYTLGGSYMGSAVMRLKKPVTVASVATTNCSYIADNGLAAEGPTGTGLLAKIVLITMMRAYFDAGLLTDTASHIVQLPRVNVTYPGVGDSIQNTGAVSVIWNTAYLKWDGNAYTSEYPTPNPTPNGTASYSESVTLTYAMKYSISNKGPWLWAYDGSPTYAGQAPHPPPSNYAVTATSACVTFPWNNTSGLADGQYYLMVEAYRNGLPLHYSYDVTKFTLKK